MSESDHIFQFVLDKNEKPFTPEQIGKEKDELKQTLKLDERSLLVAQTRNLD
jgi:hypothetical protein